MAIARSREDGTIAINQLVADSIKLDIVDFNIHERTHMDTRDRTLPCYIMSYMKEGSSVVRYAETELTAHEGDVLIVPPHLCHSHYIREPRRSIFLWWHFNLTIGGELDVLRFIKEPGVFPVSHRQDFESHFLEFVELNRRKNHSFASHIKRRAKSLEVIAYLLEGVSISNYIHNYFADVPDDFIAMLNDILKEPSLWRHVSDLAEKYKYHPAYLTNRFRHFFGTTPGKLGRNILYEKARMLIQSRDISLADVAEELGFSETSSFTRFFKSMDGLSPSSQRKPAKPR